MCIRDSTNGDDQVKTAIEGGSAPDLVMEGPERLVANWGAKGLMVDLSDLWTDCLSLIHISESENAELEDTETPKLKKRLIASLCFLVPLMYVSVSYTHLDVYKRQR